MTEVAENVSTVGGADDTKLSGYLERAAKKRRRESALSAWHIKAYTDTNGEIDLPYSHTETWISVTVSDSVRDEEGKWTWPINTERTLANLANVAKYASKMPGVKVKKEYDRSDFELHVTIPALREGDDDITVVYYASRETVCERKVVGTKVIPAQVTAERVEEIVEWDCKHVSLLAVPNNSDTE